MSSPLGYNPIAQSAPELPRHDAPLLGHAPSVYTPSPSSDFTSGRLSSGSSIGALGATSGGIPAVGLWVARVFAFSLFLSILPLWFVLYPLAAATGFVVATAFVATLGALDPALDFSSRFAFASLAYL